MNKQAFKHRQAQIERHVEPRTHAAYRTQLGQVKRKQAKQRHDGELLLGIVLAVAVYLVLFG